MSRLTKSIIDRAAYPEDKTGGAYYLWHNDPRGLGVRIYPSGLKSWVLTYQEKGRRRFRILGPVGVLTLDKARDIAIKTLGRLIERRCARIGTDAERGGVTVTVRELSARFLEERCANIKARTQESYRTTIRSRIDSKLGHLRADAVEREDVLSIREDSAPTTSNLAVALLNRIYEFGQEIGAVPVGTNPCRAIPTYKTKRRKRYLSDEEIARLADAFEWVRAHTRVADSSIDALVVILLTGCRHTEVRTLKWSYIDFENSCFRFPDSKTGAKVVPVGSVVLELLRKLDREEDEEYVFPGKVPGQPHFTLSFAWQRVAKRAGLADISIHGLRHTFATSACADGVDLERIQKLLVHTDKRMTLRYVHVLPRPSEQDRQAADQVAQAIYDRFTGGAASG